MESSNAPRMNYPAAQPQLYGKLMELSAGIHKSGLEKKLLILVDLRASQINGCAFCIDMHSKQAKLAGERELRLYALPAWRESNLYDARERAALELTEAVTRLGEHGVADSTWESVKSVFNEAELAALVIAIATINTWNRLAITFRAVPGSIDKQFGLDKAGLH